MNFVPLSFVSNYANLHVVDCYLYSMPQTALRAGASWALGRRPPLRR